MTQSTPAEDDVFVHEKALCETEAIGTGSRVWAFAHILPGAQIGKNCNVCDGVFIENDVIVGDDVTLKCGVQLWDGIRLGDRVFVGPNATFTNDRMPRSKAFPETFLETRIEDGASIGANATILPGLTIHRGAMVGAGAVVTRDVPPHAIVAGNPARIMGYASSSQPDVATDAPAALLSPLGAKAGAQLDLGVGGCFLERLPSFQDMRGGLIPLQAMNGLPFDPKRIFLVKDVANTRVRGEHAHLKCEQFLIAISGELSVVVDDGKTRKETRLNDPTIGLYLAPMVWGIQYKFSPSTVLMVVASHEYDAADYIRDYDQFLTLVS